MSKSVKYEDYFKEKLENPKLAAEYLTVTLAEAFDGTKESRKIFQEAIENVQESQQKGNVYKDLDFPNPERELAKAQLASYIYDKVEEKKISNKEASKVLRITEQKVSNILKGQLKHFSVKRLGHFLLLLLGVPDKDKRKKGWMYLRY